MIIEKRWTRARDGCKRHYTYNTTGEFRLTDKGHITLTPHRRWITKRSGKQVYRTDQWIIKDTDDKLRFTRYDQKFLLLHEAQLFVQEYSDEIVSRLDR